MPFTRKYLCLSVASAALAILPSNHILGIGYENWSLGWLFLDACLMHDAWGWHFIISWEACFINFAIWMLLGIALWTIFEKIYHQFLQKYLGLQLRPAKRSNIIVILLFIGTAAAVLAYSRYEQHSRDDYIGGLWMREFMLYYSLLHAGEDVEQNNMDWQLFTNDAFGYFIDSRYSGRYQGPTEPIDYLIHQDYNKYKNLSAGKPREINPVLIKGLKYTDTGKVIWDDKQSGSDFLYKFIKTHDDEKRILLEYIEFLNAQDSPPIPSLYIGTTMQWDSWHPPSPAQPSN